MTLTRFVSRLPYDLSYTFNFQLEPRINVFNIYYRRCTIYVLGLKENDKVAWNILIVRHVHPSVPMPVYYIEEEFTTNLKFILGKGYYPIMYYPIILLCIYFIRIRINLYKAIYIQLPYDIQYYYI